MKSRNKMKNSRAFRFTSNDRGMTLIEIMIVMAIIAGLIAALGTGAFNMFNKSKVENAKIAMGVLQKALDSYNLSCNSYPSTDEGLEALVKAPESCKNWGPEPYVKASQLQDPWGRPYLYESDGATFNIISEGRDKKPGGEGYDKDISYQEVNQ